MEYVKHQNEICSKIFRNRELYAKYQRFAAEEPGVTFVGNNNTFITLSAQQGTKIRQT